MNLYIQGSREIIVKSTGKEEVQYTSVDVWQTPTDITRTILKSDTPIEEYFKWVRTISEDDEDFSNNHINEIKDTISVYEREGFIFQYLEI